MSFLRNAAIAFVGGALLALGLTTCYAAGYRQGASDATDIIEAKVQKLLSQPFPWLRRGITVEGVPQ